MTLFWTDRGLTGAGPVPPVLVLMTDRRLADPLAAAAKLPAGAWVILRLPDQRAEPAYAKSLRQLCRQRRLRFLVSGDHRLAERLRADGLHLPEALARSAGLAPRLAWIRGKKGRLLTVAAHSDKALARAARLGADAAILSPAFCSKSHPERKSLGPVRFSLMTRRANLPVIALGGVGRGTCRRLAYARLRGIAGISAFLDESIR